MKKDLDLMRKSGLINRSAIQIGSEAAIPGVSLKYIDRQIERFIRSEGGIPAFLNYRGFPGSSCLSVNDVLIHGVPDETILQEGDILTIDVGTNYKGHITDAAQSYQIGVGEDAELLSHGSNILKSQLDVLHEGVSLYDLVMPAIKYAQKNKVHIYSEFGGHGVGLSLHDDPFIPSFSSPQTLRELKSIKLYAGETVCIEPVVSLTKDSFYIEKDGWTVRTKNKTKAVHFENCVLITEQGYELLS